MGRPTIDDDKPLLALGKAHYQMSGIKFSDAFRNVWAEMNGEIAGNSKDAARKRLQRKFDKGRNYWISRAKESEYTSAARNSSRGRSGYLATAHALSRFGQSSFAHTKAVEAIKRANSFSEMARKAMEVSNRQQKLIEAARKPPISLWKQVEEAMKPIQKIQEQQELIRKAIG